MSSRHKAREYALKALFSLDFHKKLIQSDTIVFFPTLNEQEISELNDESAIYVRYLVSGTTENIERIDKLIVKYSTKRAIQKIDRVDRCILRLSLFMMIFQKNLSPNVVIDEAVKLSQEYSNDINYKFINGLLDSIRKKEL
jgi:transcription antitermination protein NusB